MKRRLRRVSSIRGFGGKLYSPDHFRRRTTRLVSYYALFKGMAASKPTSQLSEQSHILSCPLSLHSGTLADGLGSYPLAYADYRPRTLSPRIHLTGIRSLLGVGRR